MTLMMFLTLGLVWFGVGLLTALCRNASQFFFDITHFSLYIQKSSSRSTRSQQDGEAARIPLFLNVKREMSHVKKKLKLFFAKHGKQPNTKQHISTNLE